MTRSRRRRRPRAGARERPAGPPAGAESDGPCPHASRVLPCVTCWLFRPCSEDASPAGCGVGGWNLLDHVLRCEDCFERLFTVSVMLAGPERTRPESDDDGIGG